MRARARATRNPAKPFRSRMIEIVGQKGSTPLIVQPVKLFQQLTRGFPGGDDVCSPRLTAHTGGTTTRVETRTSLGDFVRFGKQKHR